MEENLESIEGYVDHIIYRNADNGYTVLVLVCNEEEETCVGVFSDIAEGENIKAKGSYTEHPTYGRQFQVKSFEEKAPQDEVAIERYLGSGAIKGIGIALAARIVRRFKADTFRIIEEEPERLAEIKGISQRKAMEIADQVNQKKDLRQAMIFLQQYGINTTLAVKIYKTYGQEIYGILKEIHIVWQMMWKGSDSARQMRSHPVWESAPIPISGFEAVSSMCCCRLPERGIPICRCRN